MSYIIYVVVICFIVFRLFGKNIKSTNKSTKKTVSPVNRTINASKAKPVSKPSSRPVTNQPKPKTGNTASRAIAKRRQAIQTEINHTMLLEDRENDWLAKQLRDEHTAFKATKDMFDLKIEHSSHCDAAFVKQFHQHNCNAYKIDTAGK